MKKANWTELEARNGIVSAYLEFADMQARRHIPMYMRGRLEALDGFLKLSKHEILTNAGPISAAMTEEIAKEEYYKFKILQDGQLAKSDKDFIPALEYAEKALSKHKTDEKLL